MTPHARQILVLLLCAGGLITLLGQLNHGLSVFALTLSVPGLLVAFPALRLALKPGLCVVLLAGLWLDAVTPVSFGRNALLFGLAYCLLYRVRSRLPREEAIVGVVAAIFINLALCIVAASTSLGHLPDPASGALRLLADLVASQIVTALIGPWFLALQARSLSLVGAPPPAIHRLA